MLPIGHSAPDFALPDDAGTTVRLSDLLREGPLVLYFYPADFTPACTKEACMFRDAHEDLAAKGVRVVGVSSQPAETHARFRGRHRLPFPLLSDLGKKVARSYGAAALFGLWTKRVSYLIGPDGKILDAAGGDLFLGDHREFVTRVLGSPIHTSIPARFRAPILAVPFAIAAALFPSPSFAGDDPALADAPPAATPSPPATPGPAADLRARFRDPPAGRRILQIVHGLPADPAARKDLIDRHVRRGFGGLVTNVSFQDYLRSESRWEDLRSGIEAARAAGLVLWLYDEDGYPSGAAGGLVLEGHPEWAARGLLAVVKDHDGGATEIVLPEGNPISLTAHPLPGADGVLASAIDLRAEVRGGRLVFDRPGRWRICGFVEAFLFEGTHAEGNLYRKRPLADILLPEATDRFLELTHSAYAARLGPLGERFEAIFTDEPSLQSVFLRPMPFPALPWSPVLPAAFRRDHGRDLLPLLPALAADFGPEGRRVRCEFWSTVGREVASNYFGRIGDWCRAHGIASTGHLLAEEDLGSHIGFYGNFWACAARLDIPGIDCLTSDPPTVPWHIAKLLGSIACVEGRSSAMSETSDHSQRYRPPGDTRPPRSVTAGEIVGTANLLYAAGIDTTTSYYSWAGLSDEEVRSVNLRVGRAGTVLEGGRHVTDIAVLYPVESAWARFVPQRQWARSPGVDRIDAVWRGALSALFRKGRDLDIVDAASLARAEPEGPALRLGTERWRALVLPASDVVPVAALRRALDLVRGGGTVVAIGETPASAPGAFPSAEARGISEEIFGAAALSEDRDGAGAIERIHPSGGRGIYLPEAAAGLLAGVLERLVEPDFRAPPGAPLRSAHRRKDGLDLYFIANDSARPWSGVVGARGVGPAERWDTATGAIEPAAPAPDGGIALSLPAWGAAVLAFPGARGPAPAPAGPLGELVAGVPVEEAGEKAGAGRPRLLVHVPAHAKASWAPLEGSIAGAGAPGIATRIAARIEEGGKDTWCFADLRFDRPADLSRFEALEIATEVRSGGESPGIRLLAIVVEEGQDGATSDWLGEVNRSLGEAGRRRSAVSFDGLSLAGWSRDGDGRLDLGRVRSIRIGWGGHIGREGEEISFDLTGIRLIGFGGEPGPGE